MRFVEEKLLHEEVDLKWDDVVALIQDFNILEKIRPDLVVGVSYILHLSVSYILTTLS